jgi:hypothetical protein
VLTKLKGDTAQSTTNQGLQKRQAEAERAQGSNTILGNSNTPQLGPTKSSVLKLALGLSQWEFFNAVS